MASITEHLASIMAKLDTIISRIDKLISKKIMVLDIETDMGGANIIQIAYNIYDSDFNLLKHENIIINNGNGSRDYYKIIPIKDILNGMAPYAGLSIFAKDLNECSYVVGHNVQHFDMRILTKALKNLGIFFDTKKYKLICTMYGSKKYVGALDKKGAIKNPKLSELYKKLFGCEPPCIQHDAKNDIETTHKCFVKLVELGVIDRPI